MKLIRRSSGIDLCDSREWRPTGVSISPGESNSRSYGRREDGENEKIGDSIQQIERWTTWREDLFNYEDKETLDNEVVRCFKVHQARGYLEHNNIIPYKLDKAGLGR